MRLQTAALAIFVVVGCANAQTGSPLHSCETLEGASIGMGSQAEATRLFVSHAAEHVTDGAGAIGCVGLAPETEGNFYVSIFLSIEPTDFTNQRLVFDAASSTPERSKAFYVRAYDEHGNIVMSWQSWSGALSAEAQEFSLTPPDDAGPLEWEPNRIEDQDRSHVTRLEFITGTGEKNVYFNATVDNVRAVPAAQ